MKEITEAEISKLNARFQNESPEALLRWAFNTFGKDVVLASSFGAEDVVLIDMAHTVYPDVRVITLDTGRLPDETYEVMEAVRRRYKIAIEAVFPDRQAVEALEQTKGFYSFRESVENRKECCRIRKVEPLKRVLKEKAAWITGLRREQAATRESINLIEMDGDHNGLLKLNPLAFWNEKQVWDYIRTHKVPYNKLHDQNYPSIGCAPCTRAVKPGEDPRAGRWWWERADHKECGIHPPGRRKP